MQKKPANRVEINIAGVAVVLDNHAATFRRCVWGTTLLLSLVMLVGIFGERFAYFLSFPVIVDVQVIHNSSLKFPAITVCPSPSGNSMAFNMDPHALRKVYEQTFGPYPGFRQARTVLERQLDTKQLWDSTAWNISAMIAKCYHGRGLLCSQVGEFHLTYTIFGPCMTYVGRPATLAGAYHGLYLRLSTTRRVKYIC
ncbi:acid-sensing ion channel 1A-like [Penaeus japonicus]|uniref:acid-sensing ion channel 1A-like n=1 Tax=Penaeus japonicus TaxID=27405 RepID=UPI001C70F6E5|nr:acid-sensing ion channel 1A-like [Penaeus japonicus]